MYWRPLILSLAVLSLTGCAKLVEHPADHAGATSGSPVAPRSFGSTVDSPQRTVSETTPELPANPEELPEIEPPPPVEPLCEDESPDRVPMEHETADDQRGDDDHFDLIELLLGRYQAENH